MIGDIRRYSSGGSSSLHSAGYQPLERNGRAAFKAVGWQGRSFECDPRQLAHTFSIGNEQKMSVLKVDGPDMFYKAHNIDHTGPGWVMGSYKGKQGNPDNAPVTWTLIDDKKIPSKLGGVLAKASTQLGAQRGFENIIGCRPEVYGKNHPKEGLQTGNVIATHISEKVDRRLVVVNPDDRDKSDARREAVIQQLDGIILTEIERTELATKTVDGKKVCDKLILHSSIQDEAGVPLQYEIDISWMKVDPADMYDNPNDTKFGVQLLVNDPLVDFENLEKREEVRTYCNQSTQFSRDGKVRGSRDKEKLYHFTVETDPTAANPTIPTGDKDDNLGKTKITVPTNGNHVIKVTAKNGDPLIGAAVIFNGQSYVTDGEGKFTPKQPLTTGSAYPVTVSVKNKPVAGATVVACKEFTGKSWREIKKSPEFDKLRPDQKRAMSRAYVELYDIDNFTLSRVRKVRPRYMIQFHHYRESKIEGIVKEGEKVDPEEKIVVTKVISSAKVADLNKSRIVTRPDGQRRYRTEVVPLNFDPTEGHPERYKDIRIDLRSKAMFGTRFVGRYSTALGPQHLIDPFVQGTDRKAATHPGVDQKGFFGLYILTAMCFPHGNEFTAFEDNPWFVRYAGPISHSIFDAKFDAGIEYTWAGQPGMSKASTGAAMVTGPNTDTVSPVREARLTILRMAGRPHNSVKTAIPGYYVTIIEDCQSSYFDMTIFGLATATTTLPFSAGGGLDNFGNFTVQRGQRWNGGIAIYTMDASYVMREDKYRGTELYALVHNLIAKQKQASSGVDFRTCARADAAARPTNLRSIDQSAHPTVIPKLRYNEAREWLNVGTWYYVGAVRMISFALVPILALTTLSPIVAVGLGFLFACTAMTMFGWPFWAGQMAKVGVAPKDILSLQPIQLTWADLPMHTQLKAGVDVERMTLGLFRTSDRTIGNRLFPRDKRTGFWLGIVAPLTVSTAMISTAVGISFAFATLPLLFAAAPFALGLVVSRIANRLAKRFIPNPGNKSFWRAAARFAIRNTPLALGIAGALLYSPFYTAVAIPLVTAAMAGGWLAFMGSNMLNNFRVYHREQENNHALPAPNPAPGNIPRHKADTWRNTFRQAFGIEQPNFNPYATEFTRSDNPEIDPYRLWDSLKANFPTIKGADPITNLNAIVGGDGDIPDLYHILEVDGKKVSEKSLRQFVRDGGIGGVVRWAKVKRLASQTRPVIDQAQHQGKASQLSADNYERLRELNRLSIEEAFPGNTPRDRWI